MASGERGYVRHPPQQLVGLLILEKQPVKAYVLLSPLGIFTLNEEDKIISKKLFKLNIKEVINRIEELVPDKVPKDFQTIINRLKKNGYKLLIFDDELLAKNVKKKFRIETEVEKPCEHIAKFKEKLSRYAVEFRVVKGEEEFNKFMHDLSIQIAKRAVTEAVSKRDSYVVQAIRTIDDLDKTINLFAGRVREWYGLHFPELDKLVDSHETYAKLVINLSDRSDFTAKNLEKEGLSKDRAGRLAGYAKKSMGAKIDKEDLKWIGSFAEDILNLHKLRKKLEEYVDKVMKEVAPNMSSLAGPVLSARLISIAGGLENLAKMPSSTLQVLGAEKALFRALKTGSRPPKHGVIFQHAIVHQAPRWQRGKVARAVSGKLSIAARVDAFEGEFMGERLKTEVREKVDEINRKYKTPPVRSQHARRKG